MTQYTTPHSLPTVEATVDFIKDGTSTSALADYLNALAYAVNIALVRETEKTTWWRGATAISATTPAELDALASGIYAVTTGASAAALGLPVPAGGTFETFNVGDTKLYRFTPTVAAYVGQVWLNVHAGGAWIGWERIDADFATWWRGASTIPATTTAELDALAPAIYAVTSGASATSLGLPVPAGGVVEIFNVTDTRLHRFTPTVSAYAGQIWHNVRAGGVWSGWERMDPGAVQFPDVSATKSGFKNAGIPFTLPDNNATETVSDDTLRFPFQVGATGKRARLHFRNWNWATGTTSAGAVTVKGLWAGVRSGSTGNFAATPTRLLNQFVTPANGAEYVSEWFAMPVDLTLPSLFSLSYTTPVGQPNARMQSSVYRTGSSSYGATVEVPATKGTLAPFDIWLELEVPAETPIVGAFGDSNTLGHGTDPVYGAYIQQYARERGAIPYLLAQSGSTSVSWSDTGAVRWKRWAEVSKPDVVLDFLGQNDLVEGITLAQMQAKFAEHVANVKSLVTPNVVAATITPANSKSAAVNTVRREYNLWLKTKPNGVKDVFDFSVAVSDDDATIRASDGAGDGLHMNMVGHANMAAKILERPITPLVLSQSDIGALKALV